MVLEQFYPLFIFTVICTVACVAITAVIISQVSGLYLCQVDDVNIVKPLKSVQYLGILSLLSFIICITAEMCVIELLDKDYQIPDHKMTPQFMVSINIISWTFGQLFIYLLFIINLHHTFKNTPLEISKSVSLFLFILTIMFFLSRLFYIGFYLLYYNKIITETQFSFPAVALVSATEIIDLVLSIFLLHCFLNRVFKLFMVNYHHYRHSKRAQEQFGSIKASSFLLAVKDSTANKTKSTQNINSCRTSTNTLNTFNALQNNDDENQGISAESEVSLNMEQQKILFYAAKYTILSSVAIISTQLYLLSAANNALGISESEAYFATADTIYGVLLSLDCLINSLCICLNFDANTIWFFCLCCPCEHCCYSMCIFISKKCYKENVDKLMK